MKKPAVTKTKILIAILGFAGVSRALFFVLSFGLQNGATEPHLLKALSLSPFPRVFDRPHYFADRRLTIQFADGTSDEISEHEFGKRFTGPWHYKILPRHMMLYGARKNPEQFDAFIRRSLCQPPLVSSISATWDYKLLNSFLPEKSQVENQIRTVRCL